MANNDDLAAQLRSVAEHHHLPGTAAGVLMGDEVFTAAHGVTNVDSPAPVTPETLFQVASVTKTFTSAAVMLLVQEGRLALSDPVARSLPDLGPATGLDFEAITIERLLSHQSGFDGDHLFVQGEWDDLSVLADARRLFEPGTEFSYNNAAFSIAGAVIEAVTGQLYESFVRARLLKPLGMKTAAFTADEAITYSVAAPHWVNGEDAMVIRGLGWQPGWELGPVDRPAAGLLASAEQLLTWCRFQWTGTALDGSEILSRESLDRLHTPVVAVSRVEEVGLDWYVWRIADVTAIGHGGLTAGYCTELVVVPERQFAFVGLTNGTNGDPVNDAMRRWALGHFAGIEERDLEPDPAVVVDPARVIGRYAHAFWLLTVTAGGAPGSIVVAASDRENSSGWQPPPDSATLAFFADDQAVSTDTPGSTRVARFGFGADGRAEWMLWNGRRAPRIG
jgi:CubicO group peptidase (beta-lactamase class C family)